MLLEQLRSFVEEARSGLLPSGFGGGDVVEARSLLDELELAWLKGLSEADLQGAGSERGVRSTVAWLSLDTGMQRSEAAGRLRFARKLRSMAITMAAVMDGRLSLSQARILSRGVTPATIDAFGESEASLVTSATTLTASQTEFLITYWLQAADPDGARRDDREVEEGRRLAVRETLPGCDRSPSLCDVHNVIEWVRGGRTDLSNLVLLCRHHHGLLHKHRLRADLLPDATFQVWDVNGDELRSVPPPRVGVIAGKPALAASPDSLFSDVEVRERVRDAIRRFQTDTASVTQAMGSRVASQT